jgi:hypothetical protein
MVEVLSIDENAFGAIIYPNPVSERLNVLAEGLVNVSVFNVIGQKVIDVNVENDELNLDVNSLENGVYMLKISTRKGELTRRISIHK